MPSSVLASDVMTWLNGRGPPPRPPRPGPVGVCDCWSGVVGSWTGSGAGGSCCAKMGLSGETTPCEREAGESCRADAPTTKAAALESASNQVKTGRLRSIERSFRESRPEREDCNYTVG